MANSVSRIPLSASTQGEGIKIAATSTPGTLVHTTGTSDTVQDEIRLYAFCRHTTAVAVTVEWGGAGTDLSFVQTVQINAGLIRLTPPEDLVLLGSGSVALTVKVFAGTTNVVYIYGSVFRCTP